MKKFLLSFMSLLMLAIGGVWAQRTSTLTFTRACGGSGTADDGTVWAVTSDGEESLFDNTKGIHYGTYHSAVQYLQLSTSEIPGAISKIVVNASTASNVDATVNITVGGSEFGTGAQRLTSSAADYTFEGSAAGEIIVTVTKPSPAEKALYVKSITVTYNPAVGPVVIPVISPNGGKFSTPQEVTFSCSTEGAEIYYTIDGSDPKDSSATKYEQPLLLTQTTIVNAVAKKNDMFSAKATTIFVLIQSNSVNIENGITKYNYWINDNTTDIKTVELVNVPNPYQLIDLLLVQKEPLRSSSFHFEIVNNVPKIYAKNDFHIRFHDVRGYFVDEWKQFVDYSVKQDVVPVGDLQTSQTFPKVAENDIRWYTMQSAPGDTAAFKLSQPATVQVFAPSGKEVFKTSESASVQWGGIHTWEDGTYYVAVHDVTGSQSNMTLNYMHMDKYDVVEWDVHTVGNGGCSTITFKGNGFRDLYAVDLYTADGDSIHSVDISHDSDAETSVTFDFSGAELGVYDAVFHFTQEDKHFANIVTVEEAVDIELATKVSFPSTFLRGTSTTYTIKITNKGNMTAYNVPLRTYIESRTKAGISSIDFEGLNLKSPFDMILMDSVPVSDRAEVERIFKSLDDSHYFINIHTTNANNDSIIVRSAYLFVTLQPNSTKTIKLSITANETVDVWVTTEPDWFALEVSNIENVKSIARLKVRKNTNNNSYCCVKDAIECGISLAVSAADVASVVTSAVALAQGGANPGADAVAAATAVADCVAGMASNTYSWINTMVCEGETPLDNIKNNLNSKVSVLNMILSCFGTLKVAGKVAKAFKDGVSLGAGVDVVANDVGLSADCITKSTQKKPNCPPNPGGGGGSSIPYTPVDPNDIYGYLSDAGSKFMTDEVAKVNYTIEFENDTAFAQASAHTIVIRDTLDNRYFDLKSFLPTSVKIGEREAFLDEATDVKTSGSMTSFLKTIDMRPEINAIAQVEGEYSQQTGIAKWTFTSLDPMTMEPTDDLMQGILPVNYDGTSGIGEVMFEVGVKPNKGHGTEIMNRASIVFDYEEPILTPMWVNTVDAIAPVSHVSDVQQLNDSVAVVSIDASDELSGVWRYDVYVQYGEGSGWWKAAENVPIDTVAYVKIYEGIDHGFYVVATDSAGNVEVKTPVREWPKSDDDDIPTVISKTSTTSTVNDPFYNLQGERVKQPKKGIFIRRGKKEVKR